MSTDILPGDVGGVVLATLTLECLVMIPDHLLDAIDREMARGGVHSQSSHLVLIFSIEGHEEF